MKTSTAHCDVHTSEPVLGEVFVDIAGKRQSFDLCKACLVEMQKVTPTLQLPKEPEPEPEVAESSAP